MHTISFDYDMISKMLKKCPTLIKISGDWIFINCNSKRDSNMHAEL